MIGKQMYEAPAIRVVVVAQEGIICDSEVNGRNSIDGWENGGDIDDEVNL